MTRVLEGKTALVTAASKGIGFGIAAGLKAAGCHVIATSSNLRNLEVARGRLDAMTGGSCETVILDVRDPASAHREAAKLATLRDIDILVTNGPGPQPCSADTVTDEALWEALNVTLFSAISLCRAVLPGMKTRKYGRIVLLASSTALEPDEGFVLSNVARASVVAYAKTLSREVARNGITVNSVLTASVLTDRTDELLKLAAASSGVSIDTLTKQAHASIPVGYIATPQEFAPAIVFLASPAAAYVNGVSLPIDGGYMRAL